MLYSESPSHGPEDGNPAGPIKINKALLGSRKRKAKRIQDHSGDRKLPERSDLEKNAVRLLNPVGEEFRTHHRS